MMPLFAQEVMPTVSNFDWNSLINLATAAMTVLGSAFALWVGFSVKRLEAKAERDRMEVKERENQLNAKLERDRMELNAKMELARLEARKQVRRVDRKAKALVQKTEEQNTKLDKIEKQTNGMNAVSHENGRLKGIEEGKQQHKAETLEVAKVVAVEVAKQVASPQQVEVVNQGPIAVNQVEGGK